MTFLEVILLFGSSGKPLSGIVHCHEIKQGVAQSEHLGIVQTINLPGHFHRQGAHFPPKQANHKTAHLLPTFVLTLQAAL